MVVGTGNPERSAVWVYGAMGTGLLAVSAVQWWLVVRDGQSVGKRWLDIRIVRTNGTLPGFYYGIAVRSWLPLVLGLTCGLFRLVDLLSILRQDRRTLHDHLAGTRVVRADLPFDPGSGNEAFDEIHPDL